MKIKVSIIMILAIVSVVLSLSYENFNIRDNEHSYISIVYTDKNYISTYGVYDLISENFQKVYSRKNQDYSDFVIDKKNNVLYYSDLINGKYGIYEMNLADGNSSPINLLGSNFTGDIFNLYNNKLIFRTNLKGYKNDTLGIYNLTDKKFIIVDDTENDLTIYNFCYNRSSKKIYTIERSLNEMHTKNLPYIHRHMIFKYNENGLKEKQVYTTEKFINNISINKNENRILYDATNFENEKLENKIYLVDLQSQNEQILIEPNVLYGRHTFTLVKSPVFSSNGKGFYFLGSTSESNIIEHVKGSDPITARAIYYYEFEFKKISKIFEISDGIINQFKLQI